ncbi:MAG: ATP-binding cassette domain-containing protein [Jatrophihabitans sp.]
MNLGAFRERLRSRTMQIILVAVLVLVGVGVIVGVASSNPSIATRNEFVTGTPEPDGTAVRLDTTLFLPEQTPAPAVLLSQGFGGDKQGLAADAQTLARGGYVVLTYTARGFGESGGLIHFASPNYEVADAKLLVTHLAGLAVVKKKNGNPEIAAQGSSYGGGLSLLLAAADKRIDAVSADITWNNLQHAFFPNAAGDQPGPYKKLWVGQLFGNAFGDRSAAGLAALLGKRGEPKISGSVSCGRFAADICAAYQASAAAGAPTAAMTTLMREASPASVLDKITAPTQLTQGEQDSLFPLSEADANARGIAANGTPVSVDWRVGGHDGGNVGNVAITNARTWFDKVFAGDDLKGAQPFTFAEEDGVISAATGDSKRSILQTKGYPGIDGTPRDTRKVMVGAPEQQIGSPAGGSPAVITSIPGLGAILGRLSSTLASLPTAPGQTALFVSQKANKEFAIVGTPTVRITVTSKTARDATLFVGLRDLDPDGTATLPSQLIAPLRVTGLTPGQPRTIEVRLPSVVQKVLVGHRLVLSVSSTDFAYAGPQDARAYTISVPDDATAVSIPTATGTAISGGAPFAWLIVGIVVALAVALLIALVLYRRRHVLHDDPDLMDVPVSVRGLVKEYAGGYRAVDDISFQVERGQVVGLLGPNGAGKTTALRVLVGLITPTKGQLHVFGEPIVPGAPVLSRIGCFIEGPGFLPHLTGRENLRLYWAATGRPDNEAEFQTALDIAGLGGSIDRRVRTYSQGMRQRLGIAQAMLGLPELLVLDEPTNGLDPPQIAEMREVMKQYAETGRTVVVSSHLLSEVEQTCTHVVVMHKGRIVSSGSVDEIAASDTVHLSVDDPTAAEKVLAAAGIDARLVTGRRSLEDVFLELIGEDVDA